MTPHQATAAAANLEDPRAKRVSVLNVTDRSIVIRGPRSHVMVMHNPHSKVSNVTFKNVGRTDKSKPLVGDNVRGRYPLHFHRCRNAAGDQAEAVGCVVWGSPGWGIVNHSSDCKFLDNICVDVFGAAFVTEAGDETGIMANNYAVGTRGITDGTTLDARIGNDDFGFLGDAFWMQGGGVAMQDNEAYCYDGTGINFAPFPMKDGLGGTVKANLNGVMVPTRNVGLVVGGFLSLGGRKSGIELWQTGPVTKEPWEPTLITEVSIHNVALEKTGLVLTHYSKQLELTNFNISGKAGQVGFERNYATANVQIDGWQCRGLGIDVMAPALGTNTVSNIDTDNATKCVTIPHDPHAETPSRKLALSNIGGPIVAEDPTNDSTGVFVPAAILGEQSTPARHVAHFYKPGSDLSGVKEQDLWMVFNKRFYNGITRDGFTQLLHLWQRHDYVFVHANPLLGGKSNAQLETEYGMTIFGSPIKPFLYFDGLRLTTKADYAYNFRRDDNPNDRTKGTPVFSGRAILTPGLNVITATIEGVKYGELVYLQS